MLKLREAWRWFGPDDPVKLKDIRQTGAEEIVSALHHISNGDVWPINQINRHQKLIQSQGLQWSIVESIPVHEDIKRRSGNYKAYISNYKQNIVNLAECGIGIITYNFMPVLDWTRTDLSYQLKDGSKALFFEKSAFVAFDLFILKRVGAQEDYKPYEIELARRKYDSMIESERLRLIRNIIAGLPGATTKSAVGLDEFRDILSSYNGISADNLRENLIFFLKEIIPVAEEHGARMAIHPDDPPFSLLGLPRVVSTEEDIAAILHAVDSGANGLCFCTGSLGVRKENNLEEMLNRFGERIHFAHLRATKRDEDGNFYEAPHLDGDVDMYGVVKRLVELAEERQYAIPIRPDHGHQKLDDLDKHVNPGYSGIGRLQGLAELRGLELGIVKSKLFA